MTSSPADAEAIQELVDVVRRLLDPVDGCVWNRAQTHRTLAPYVVEEAYELVDAIESGDHADVVEELGDVLYQVVLHAGIASRAGEFELADVARGVADKMTSRHTHVFGDDRADTIEEVERLWRARKAVEKASRASRYDGVPTAMPPLERALAIVARTPEGPGAGDVLAAAEVSAADAGSGVDAAWGLEVVRAAVAARARGVDPIASLRAAANGIDATARRLEADGAA